MTDPAFWQRFLDEVWENSPAHFGASLEPLLSADELFAASVGVGDLLHAGDAQVRVRWSDDGHRTLNLAPNPTSAALLPQRSDGSFEGYAQRMRDRDTFFIQLPTLQLYSALLWPRLVRFCQSLFAKTGVPGHMTWTDAYIGRYAVTPFGVHVDGASNFTFGVCGKKTLYLWEPDFYHAHMAAAGPRGYEPFLAMAHKLTVRAGEVIYWPSRFYHVAVPDGLFSVTMNLAFYPEHPQSAWLERAFRSAIAGTTTTQTAIHGLSLPEELAQACRRATQSVTNHALERELLRCVIAHCTGFGFLSPPPKRPATTFELGTQIIRCSPAAIACEADGHGSMFVSANGYVIDVQEEVTLRDAIFALNAGQRVETRASSRALFERLHQWGAVERHWGEETGNAAKSLPRETA